MDGSRSEIDRGLLEDSLRLLSPLPAAVARLERAQEDSEEKIKDLEAENREIRRDHRDANRSLLIALLGLGGVFGASLIGAIVTLVVNGG